MEINEINLHNRYTVAVKVNGAIVGHVPREVSKIVYYFIKNGGSVVGEVRGRRQCSIVCIKGLEIRVYIRSN